LEGSDYFDRLDDGRQKHQLGAVTFVEEVIRIYAGTENELIIDDANFNRQIRIASSSNKTTVVWNPWEKTSAKIPDLEDEGYQRFICVETGSVDKDIIVIPPGSKNSLLTQFKITRN